MNWCAAKARDLVKLRRLTPQAVPKAVPSVGTTIAKQKVFVKAVPHCLCRVTEWPMS